MPAMDLESWLAVMAHSADDFELQAVAEELCTVAGMFIAAGNRAHTYRLLAQAARVIELRWFAPSPRHRPVRTEPGLWPS